MEEFKVAAVQMNALRGALAHNLAVHEDFTRRAADAGCRLVLFPELSVTAHYGDADVTALAEEADCGSIYTTMHKLAQSLDCVIGYGFCERAHGAFYNAYALMGAQGLIGVQRKVHASQDEYFSFRMGRTLEVFDLGFCRVGIAVCFDANFAEVWRVLALKGADLLLLPHASRTGWGEELSAQRQLARLETSLAKLPGRYGIYAQDNNVFAVYANQIGYNGHTTHLGGACVFAPDGALLARSEPDLADLWISATLAPQALEAARNSRYSLMRTRRPELYQELTRMV